MMMRNQNTARKWMIYGAYGYSGRLIAEEALRRGHRPVLAGRDSARVAALATELGLDGRAFALDKLDVITKKLNDIDLVVHAAGPFVHTSNNMLQACLLTSTHYTDITGEYSVFENTFSYDEMARQRGVALVGGVGFDVVPSDCLAKYVADQVPNATQLEIAVAGLTDLSAGTAKSSLNIISAGNIQRRDGRLVNQPLGKAARQIRFPDHPRTLFPLPWGDISTAYRSTGIPNITTYLALPKPIRQFVSLAGPIIPALARNGLVQAVLNRFAERSFSGPAADLRESGKSYVWAKASDAAGNAAEAWLQTPEPYHLTAMSAVSSVENLIKGDHYGTLTPAQAFGADFILSFPGAQRYDQLG
jgi:short subunit dehydrogenase-like uncharacterized protein